MIIAAYQGPSVEGNEDHAFAKIDATLQLAAAKGAEMAVFPELYLLGYNQMAHHANLAQPQGDAWETRLSDLCKLRGCGITIGWPERVDDTIYNSASTFDSMGKKLGHYRKIQLWGPTEQSVFAFGDRYTTFILNGFKTALLICYDIEFAPHVRALANMGVALILVPTANPTDFGLVCNTLVPARATETNTTIVYANFCGSDTGLTFSGQSIIAGPYDMRLAQASRDEETLLIADLAQIQTLDPSVLSTQAADYRKVSL